MIEETRVHNRRLGRLPAKASPKALQLSDFVTYFDLPKSSMGFWRRRKPFALRTYGNTEWGDCTRASQAHMIVRMERLEQRRTVSITDEEVIARYREMVRRRYGTDEDMGAYETDALDDWRNPETTIRDVEGHAYTIDAYLRINAFNHRELRAGLALSGAKGIKVCLNLPLEWQGVDPPKAWDLPEGQAPVGRYLPGSWGGHSMMSVGYEDPQGNGLWLPDTWGRPDRLLTWRAAAVYLDEAHMVIDSVDGWRRRIRATERLPNTALNLKRVVEAVNDVSSIKIAA